MECGDPVAALECGDLAPLWPACNVGANIQDLASQNKSGDESPHSKILAFVYQLPSRVDLPGVLYAEKIRKFPIIRGIVSGNVSGFPSFE